MPSHDGSVASVQLISASEEAGGGGWSRVALEQLRRMKADVHECVSRVPPNSHESFSATGVSG